MIWLALLLVGAVISGNEAYMEPLDVDALQHDVLAKGMLLQTASLHVQKMYHKEKNDKGEDEVKYLKKIDTEDHVEVISAIYDRYVSFKLVINYYSCVLFYKQGAAVAETGEAEGCLEYARYVHWVNGEFTADQYFVQLKIQGAPDAKYNLGAVVEKLKILFNKQKKMVEAFEESGKDEEHPYRDVFKLLRQPSDDVPPLPHLDEDYAVPLERAAVERGEVEDTERPMVDHPKQMVRDALVEEDAQRSHFKVTEESLLDASVHNFQNVHEVQYAGLLFTGLEMRTRNVDRVLSPKDWEIIPAEPGSPVDFLFRFTKDPPKRGGKGKATDSPREGGGPSSGGEDFGTVLAGGFAAAAGSSSDVGPSGDVV